LAKKFSVESVVRSFAKYFSSFIGSKAIVGLTGLALCGFLLVHLLGNLLILISPEAYNTYSHKLITNPLLPVAEVGLVVVFVAHVIRATALTIKNRNARPAGYALASRGEKGTTPVSRSLIYQGAVIFVFVILHLITFKYGAHYTATYNGVEMRDLHRLVVEVFKKPGYVVWYLVALIILSMHLGHGFQSLGLGGPKYGPVLKKMGIVYDFVVSVGFIVLPVYVYFIHS
jgi:succinate dehydrogenase / fumarate reductase, cytochrome b subunit